MLDQESAPKPTNSPFAVFLAGFIAAGALGVASFVAWQQFGPQPGAMSPPGQAAPEQGQSPAARASMDANAEARIVVDEIAKLGVKPHTGVSITDKSLSAADALRRGDYRSAETLTRAVLEHSTLQSFSFAPFNRYINSLSQGDDAQYLEGLNAWVLQSPKSALAYLLRASYFYQTAWLVRGSDFDRAVPLEHGQAFNEYLGKADNDIIRSISIDSAIPWSYYLRMQISGSRADSQRLEEDFDDAIARFPSYYALYDKRLHFLQPKWGGSTEAMYEFVQRYAAKAPPSSPLKLLYVQLAANLLNAAWVDCGSLKHELLTACIDARMNIFVTRGLTDGVTAALGVYKHSDPVQFNNALWPILAGMANTPGDTTTVNSMLQLAADAMGSDNQLVHDSKNNSFVLDDITAWVWLNLGNSVNVDQKFRDALDDVMRTSFADDDERNTALATIYDDMAMVARRRSQYTNLIIYHDTANAIAGINHGGTPYLKCFAQYKLGQFQQAVEECTKLIDAQRDVSIAHYYRARAFEGLGNYEASLADFSPVAEHSSDNYVRLGAVIEMDHVTALLGRYSTELEIFDKYPFVFDASIQPPDDLAIVYNNRCFAYMKLGKLREALDDCNTSLKYGRLPDALHKQQELSKMLSGQPI